jgi:hypothetical protein
MKNIRRIVISAAPVLALMVIGCEEKAAPPAPKPAASSAPKAAPTPTSASAPSAPTAGAPGAAASEGTVAAAGLSFPLPKGWQSVPPANSMRLAEVTVADASGDAAKACSIVFSQAGGDIQANIDRWAGQVKDASGQPSKPNVQKKTVAGVNVTIAEMTGSYAGMGDAAPKPNTTLRAAIVETAEGMLFIKMTGPAEPMAAAAAGFNSMIDGMKKQ